MSIEDTLAEAATRHPIPAFVAAAIHDGKIVHQSTHGLRNAEANAPMTIDTVFRLYSMTKAVTATAVLQLMERGKLNLDAPAADYAPLLANLEVLTGFDADGAPRLRRPHRAPKVRNLLNHNAGFGYGLWNADLARYATWKSQTATAGPPPHLVLAFDPEESWEYGIGLDWAGRIIENVSGLTLEAYFKENIFAPLGMHDTSFIASPSMIARLADVHYRASDGGLGRLPRTIPQPPSFFNGGGGLFGTAPDYLKFLEAIAGDGSAKGVRILTPESLALMTACDEQTPRVRVLKSTAPMVTNDLDLWGDAEARYSLGFLVNPQAGPHGRAAGSLAWGGLSNTYYWVDRTNRLAAVLMTQLSPFADKNVLAVFAAFERALYEEIGR